MSRKRSPYPESPRYPNRLGEILDLLNLPERSIVEAMAHYANVYSAPWGKVSVQSVSHWVRGKVLPSAPVRVVLEQVLSQYLNAPVTSEQIWPEGLHPQFTQSGKETR